MQEQGSYGTLNKGSHELDEISRIRALKEQYGISGFAPVWQTKRLLQGKQGVSGFDQSVTDLLDIRSAQKQAAYAKQIKALTQKLPGAPRNSKKAERMSQQLGILQSKIELPASS